MGSTRTLGLAASLVFLAVCTQALAADDVGKWYLAPMAFDVRTGTDRNVDDGAAFGLAFGKNVSDHWAAELAFDHGYYKARNAADDLSINALSLVALRHFFRDSKIHPFLSIGYVQSDESRDSTGSYNRQMIQAGLGLLGNVHTAVDRSSVIQLRAEVRERWNVDWVSEAHQGQPNDFMAGIGFQFNWGAPAPVEAPAPVREEAPADVDSDGDGVPDRLDKCPNTPRGVKVDSDGCPLDADHDGVPDYLDKCPGTPPGMKVDANGCEVEAIVLKGVNFDYNSAKLTPASDRILDEVVALIKLRPGATAVIGGHTDGRGKAAYNQRLSEQRASAVRDYLVAHGIDAKALTAKGYGKTQPIASNDTEEGRAQNRRVTLQFTTFATR
ncbi:MAG TPA: OmpA family protein [Steroidobacteraceae bacterium]|nr:OmpA family protein [Steroidobacteraceae bacterium]